MNRNESFVDILNKTKAEIKHDLVQRQGVYQKEEEERNLQEKIREQEHQRKIEISKREFEELGVVDAFKSVISTGYFSRTGRKDQKEPKLNWRGKQIGEVNKKVSYTIPASIEFNIDEILLITDYSAGLEWDDPDNYTFIGIRKINTDNYKIGYFNNRIKFIPPTRDNYNYYIKSAIVQKDDLIGSLAKLVGVIQELDSLRERGVKLNPYSEREKDLLPHFP